MAKKAQWYREYLEDARQQIGWVDRNLHFRRAIREGVPALLQHSPEEETLLSLLVADLRILPAPAEQRCLFVLTSHNLHIYPRQHSRITTFVGEQISPLWRIDNSSHTIEIPFTPAEDMEAIRKSRLTDDSLDNPTQTRSLLLRVHRRDWVAANGFWSTGLAAGNHWGNAAAIMQHMEEVMQKVQKR